MVSITIPLGATVRVRRQNGVVDTYVFRGEDAQGLVFEDPAGNVSREIGLYTSITIDLP